MKGWKSLIVIYTVIIAVCIGDNGKKLDKMSAQLKTLNSAVAKIVKGKT
jgi:outer membrane murein-binding lipoprotein Lpp